MKRIGQGLGEIRRIFVFALLAFIIIGLISTIYFRDKEEVVGQIVGSFLEEKSDIFLDEGPVFGPEGAPEQNPLRISARGLFVNNLRASIVSNLLGIIPFIFLPAFILIVNAGIIGTVFAMGGELSGLKLLIGGILPHSIFEIPALLISISMGLFLCSQVSKKLLRKEHKPIFELIKRQVLISLLVVAPLLLVAALIESRITPLILMRLL